MLHSPGHGRFQAPPGVRRHCLGDQSDPRFDLCGRLWHGCCRCRNCHGDFTGNFLCVRANLSDRQEGILRVHLLPVYAENPRPNSKDTDQAGRSSGLPDGGHLHLHAVCELLHQCLWGGGLGGLRSGTQAPEHSLHHYPWNVHRQRIHGGAEHGGGAAGSGA